MKTQALTDFFSSLDQEIVVLTLTTLTRLYELDADAANLYVFYCKNAKIQSNQMGYTNRIKADDVFCRTGLKWGKEKFYRAKKLLKSQEFIEDVVRRNPDGTILGHFVQINFLLKSYKGKNDSYNPQSSKPDTGFIHSPQNQRVVQPEGGFQETNADNKNRNADKRKKATAFSPSNTFRPVLAKDAIEQLLYPNTIGQDVPAGLKPLTAEKLYEIAARKNVSLVAVQRLHETILTHISNGNKYKTKNVSQTLQIWLNNGLARGDVQLMSEEERMIFDMQSPERLKRRKKLIEKMKEKKLL
jgi:hypothetical protein